MTAPYDPGVQPERTELAWRRTALSICFGSLVSMRVLPELIGTLGLAVGGAGVAFSAVLWVLARPRCRAFREAMAHPDRARPGALHLAALTAFSTTVGLLLLILVVAFRH